MVSICINIPLKTSSLNWSLRHKSRLCQWQIQRSKLQIYTETSREVLSLHFTQNDSEIRNSMNFWGRNQPFIHTPPRFTSQNSNHVSTINYQHQSMVFLAFALTKISAYALVVFLFREAPVAVRKSCCSCSLIPLRSWNLLVAKVGGIDGLVQSRHLQKSNSMLLCKLCDKCQIGWKKDRDLQQTFWPSQLM